MLTTSRHVFTGRRQAAAGEDRQRLGRDTRTQHPGEWRERLYIPAGRETRCEGQGRREPGRVGHPHSACRDGPVSNSGVTPRFRTAVFQQVASLSHNTGITSRIRPRHHSYRSLGSSTAAGIRGTNKEELQEPHGNGHEMVFPHQDHPDPTSWRQAGAPTHRAKALPWPGPALCTPTGLQYKSLPSSPH